MRMLLGVVEVPGMSVIVCTGWLPLTGCMVVAKKAPFPKGCNIVGKETAPWFRPAFRIVGFADFRASNNAVAEVPLTRKDWG